MSVDAKISRVIDNNNVQVDISSKNARTRYYQVPKNNADNFIKQYKKQDKKASWITNTAFGASILVGVFGANALTKKMNNKLLKFVLNTAAGVGCAIAAMFGSGKYIESEKNKILEQNRAKEIFFEA